MTEPLALHGGPKAFPAQRGPAQPKVGVDEFLALAQRFGFSDAALNRLRSAVSNADLPPGGASLARYYTAHPHLAAGPKLEALARQLFAVPYALPTSSGTGALHAAFVAAGVGPGTEVIVPACGFMATACAILAAGGVPVFCDVDLSFQIDPTKIEKLITPRTIALAPTHHWGNVADMDPVLDLARRRKLKVVEDCAQSPGAKYHGRYVGTLGDLGCFSISAYKIIGGGEGGLVLTSNQRLHERACQLAECGGLWRPDRFAPPRYDGELFAGTNYRLSDLESTLIVVQLAKLDAIVRRHHEVKNRIARQLHTFREITPQKINDVAGEIGYMLRFFPQTTDLAAKIVAALQAEGVACSTRGPHAGPDWHVARDMFPVTTQTAPAAGASPFTDPRYLARGGQPNYRPGLCPVAEDLYDRCVSLQLNQWLSPADCDAIALALNKVFNAYCTPDPTATPWFPKNL